jgi:predicted DNA-binding transcriptional regulator AlpA
MSKKKKNYLSISQYAKKCKVSTTTIYNRIKSGEIKIAEPTVFYKFDLIDADEYPPNKKTKKRGRKEFNMDMIN